MASLRSLRSATRGVSRYATSRVMPSLTAPAKRGYRQPARDPMTGEVIQLPELDVSDLRPESHTVQSSRKSSLVKVAKNPNPKQRPASSKLVFGHTFTDHMLTVPWSSTSGWGTPEIKPCEEGRPSGAFCQLTSQMPTLSSTRRAQSSTTRSPCSRG